MRMSSEMIFMLECTSEKILTSDKLNMRRVVDDSLCSVKSDSIIKLNSFTFSNFIKYEIPKNKC